MSSLPSAPRVPADRPQQPALAASGIGGSTTAIQIVLVLTALSVLLDALVPDRTASVTPSTLLQPSGIVSLLVFVATIVLAVRDWRDLRTAGLTKPMHWAWMLLPPVYMIGRGVVFRRRIGRGLAPTVVYLVITVISMVVSIV